MTYEQALDYINGTLRFGIRPGLGRIARLLELLGNPQNGMRFVHVAGTNGKGSVSTAIACALQEAGYRTGLYTSPYIEDFRERMRVDGKMIGREEIADEVARIKPLAERVAAEGEQPTEFEIVTAAAFGWFKRQDCGVVVLEVGLGGRFDATNVIGQPLVAVITSISYDHTAILGDTLAKIAFEKCGIIKPGGVTVSSPGQDDEALEVIMRACAERGSTLMIPNRNAVQILREDIRGSEIQYGEQRLCIPLAGRHQIANFITASEALRALKGRGLPVPKEAVERGFARVRFPARLELLHENPVVLLDGAHNPGGVRTLRDFVERYLKGKKIVVVMGMLRDKDYEDSIARMASLAEAFYALTPDSPRALPAAAAAETAARSCPKTAAFDDYGTALLAALREAGEDGAVVICGSLYLAGRMRAAARALFGGFPGQNCAK